MLYVAMTIINTACHSWRVMPRMGAMVAHKIPVSINYHGKPVFFALEIPYFYSLKSMISVLPRVVGSCVKSVNPSNSECHARVVRDIGSLGMTDSVYYGHTNI